MRGTSRRRLTTASAADLTGRSPGSVEHEAVVEAARDGSATSGGQGAGIILAGATIELVAMADGRYLIYYSWPNDV